MLRKYLTIWLAIGSGLAFWWPSFGGWLGSVEPWWDPFTAGRHTIAIAVIVTMFCIGALLPADEVRQLGRQWASILFGTAVQYVTMPLLAWLAVVLWDLSGDLRVGVLLVGCVPGAMASNVLTMAARGNVSYSVGLTTSATLLSPLVVPVALLLTGGGSIPGEKLQQVSLELLWMVVLPVLLGFGVCRLSDSVRRSLDAVGETVANLAILGIIACVVGRQRDYLREAGSAEVLATMGLALLAVNLVGYLVGYVAGWSVGLDERRRRALTIEVGMQNAGVGTQLAIAVLGAASPATVPTAMYTFGCMLTGTLLAQAFGRSPVSAVAETENPSSAPEQRSILASPKSDE